MITAVQSDVREQAAQRFAQLGWPAMELEEWKYTNLAPIQRVEWREDDMEPRLQPGARPAKAGAPFVAASLRKHGAAELVFVNGRIADVTGGAAGVEILPIGEASAHPMFEKHYARYADYQRHAMTALNTANAQNGAFIVVRDVLIGAMLVDCGATPPVAARTAWRRFEELTSYVTLTAALDGFAT